MKRHGNTNDDLAVAIADLGHTLADFVTMVDRRFTGVEGRLNGVEGRLDGVEERLDGMEGRLFSLEVGQRETNQRLTKLQGDHLATQADIKELYKLAAA